MSEILTQTGTLPVGIEVDGVVHREFELRPLRLRDSVAELQNAAGNGDAEFGFALVARQLVRLGSLPPDKISLALLLDAYDVDIQVMMGAAATLRARLLTFRDGSAAIPGDAGDAA